MLIYYITVDGKEKTLLGRARNRREAAQITQKKLDKIGFKSYYSRQWMDKENNTYIDFGSHIHYFLIVGEGNYHPNKEITEVNN